ncbi:acetyl-CoA C-acyltransferase [Humibacter ginsenosidimutans]|uniref:Probable acetyl-CoA acetyltransferase n=1 Tax=Humibacter ginsenosidimutans TaxID=2599293 RepID=A0A5B8M6R4_9MICO|nr:acetyl-CoA C-acyltransferase [Humibacter ginsenosidimutans]QDZ15901.1 acetyl-CoA C-acyltransferase [Humibacter ginsenosidimutans]
MTNSTGRSALIASYARTPFLRFNGGFATVPAVELGAHALRAALSRAGIAPDRVDIVQGAQVLQAAAGQNPARQSAVLAGIPMTVPAITLNAVCLSGTLAVAAAAKLIEDGEADIVAVVGQESMSLAPHAWSGSRMGQKYGAIELVDTLEFDGLTDAFQHVSMGASTEEYNGKLGITREEQDAYAASSHQRASANADFVSAEIEPYDVPSRKGATTYSADDGLRADTTAESLSALRPAFASDGTITAGNSSQITDGAAALIIVGDDVELSVKPLARIVSQSFVAGPDTSLHAQPSNAIAAAARKAGVELSSLAAVEINEAFAAVSVHSTRALGIDPAIVNADGGAIAIGHPLGASGARIVGHLARRLQASGAGSVGAAGLCGGGGQGAAVVLEAL